jgi:hypothetical protein
MKNKSVEIKIDDTLDTLLDLNGTRFYYDSGFWLKIAAKRVVPSKHRPYGINYNLTLHDSNNNRILGYDNAHGVKNIRTKSFSGRRIVYDHRHDENEVYPYEFTSAAQLLTDFFKDIDGFFVV